MNARVKKILLLLLAAVLLAGAGQIERVLYRERDVLGFNRFTELKGAPPVLALTTVALGGFRGLISNALWIRMSELQDEDKFFEMVQLADWIGKLEPHFSQVWVNQAWNMAYNISVKLKDPADRWRWVYSGIELLRDQGLLYNPNDVLIHRELGWIYQHKMGGNADDAHLYYKQAWANEMDKVFGPGKKANLDELVNPTTEDALKRVAILTNTFKMDPRFMKEVNEKYGPMEWRLPEAHAVYWAAEGLEAAKRNERKIDPNDLIMLRRTIYQSMQISFQRGRLISVNSARHVFEFGPNLEIIPKVNAAYEYAEDDDVKNRDHIQLAHRNFVKDAVYFLYTYDRMPEARLWYKYLCDKYPDKLLVGYDTNSLPCKMSLEDYCIFRVQDEVNSPGRDKVMAILQGLERTSLLSLAIGEYDRASGTHKLAQQIWDKYNDKIKMRHDPLAIPPLNEIRAQAVKDLMEELTPEMANRLRTELGMPIPVSNPTNAPASDETSTNSVPANATATNSPSAQATTNAPAAEAKSGQ